MCGVLGFFSRNPNKSLDQPVIQALFRESKVRGLHAFGFTAWVAGPGLLTFKAASLEENEANLQKVFGRYHVIALVGHTRYSTSGDWKLQENNQPLHIAQGSNSWEISLAFNGVISMKTKAEYSKEFGKAYVTENDGEIFCRKVLDGEDWEAFVREGSFSFAGCFLFQGELWALRNANRPLWWWKTQERIVFASTKDIFRRALPEVPSKDFKPLPAGKAYKAEELLP